MKSLPPSGVLLICAALLATPAFGETAQELLTTAQTAYLRGDIETAKRNFEMVNQLDPRNATAIGYLRTIRAREAQMNEGAKQEKQLQALIMPQVQFREATLGSALDYLKQQAAKASGGKVAVNFVLQIPDEQAKSQTVTLSLTNVPFTAVLRYLGSVANLTFAYDKYAIVVKPNATATATATTAPVAQ